MEAKNKEDIPQIIQQCVQKIIQKENFQNIYTRRINKITTGDNNFLGELYEIEIKGETEKGNKELHIFIKYIIKNDNFQLCSIPEVFGKEAFFYLDLSKIFENLQDEAKILTVDRLNVVKCYDETNSECIVLENLKTRGYKTWPLEVMSEEFAKEAISQLAKFHGLSFVLENKYPDYFEKKIKALKASVTYDEYWDRFAEKVSNIAISKFDDKIKHRINKFLKTSSEKYAKYLNGLTSTLKCLCHGDYKMNNIMFKKENGRIAHLIPIDYQHIYYGCPIMDFIFFIYAASDGNFRENNLHNLKDIYYESLTSFLKCFGIDFGFICSKTEFDQCFENCRDYALLFSLYILPLFYVVDEKPSAKDNIMDLALKLDDKYHERMKEIVDEFIGLNII